MSLFKSAAAAAAEHVAEDPRPAGQQASAEPLHAQPNDPATQAQAGTPQYANFGHVGDAPATPDYDAQGIPTGTNDGSNDNPDEFSELRGSDQNQKQDQNKDQDPAQDRGARLGHADQNQAPEAVAATQNKDADVQRAAWSDDDRRYAGGKPEATWQENNDREHQNND